MAGFLGLGSSAGSVLGATAAACVIAGTVAGVVYYRENVAQQASPAAVAPEGQAPLAEAAPVAEVASAETLPPETLPPETLPPETLPPETEERADAPITPEDTPEDTAEETAAPDPAAPSFDVVRVDPQGGVLIAGRAAPSTSVAVVIDGAEVHRATADPSGSFAALFQVEASTAPRVVGLVMDLPGQDPLRSSETVIIAPIAAAAPDRAPDVDVSLVPEPAAPIEAPAAGDEPAAAEEVANLGTAPTPEALAPQTPTPETPTPEALAPDTTVAALSDVPLEGALEGPGAAKETAAPEAVANLVTTPAPETPAPDASVAALSDAPREGALEGPRAANETAAPATPQAPTVLLADDSGLRVLQDGGGAPQATTEVVIDTISYDTEGEVLLGGRGAGESFVRVYLDNRPVETTRINSDGQWRTALPDVDTGVYTLRVDALDAEGAVTSRMETPFRREEPTVVAALDRRSDAARAETGVITVQPGNTLWGIAREEYGDGFLYVRVFRANRDRIRNPDLIYPGQVFALPQE